MSYLDKIDELDFDQIEYLDILINKLPSTEKLEFIRHILFGEERYLSKFIIRQEDEPLIETALEQLKNISKTSFDSLEEALGDTLISVLQSKKDLGRSVEDIIVDILHLCFHHKTGLSDIDLNQVVFNETHIDSDLLIQLGKFWALKSPEVVLEWSSEEFERRPNLAIVKMSMLLEGLDPIPALEVLNQLAYVKKPENLVPFIYYIRKALERIESLSKGDRRSDVYERYDRFRKDFYREKSWENDLLNELEKEIKGFPVWTEQSTDYIERGIAKYL